MELKARDIDGLAVDIRHIRKNLKSVNNTKEEIRDLHHRLDILSEFITTHNWFLEWDEQPRKRKLIKKIKSDIELYSQFINKVHKEILDQIKDRKKARGPEGKVGIPPDEESDISEIAEVVTPDSKVLIKGINNEKEFFIEFTDSRENEEIDGKRDIYIVFVGKPIAKEVISEKVGYRFKIDRFEYEIIQIFRPGLIYLG